MRSLLGRLGLLHLEFDPVLAAPVEDQSLTVEIEESIQSGVTPYHIRPLTCTVKGRKGVDRDAGARLDGQLAGGDRLLDVSFC
jgi:hypothetical protein